MENYQISILATCKLDSIPILPSYVKSFRITRSVASYVVIGCDMACIAIFFLVIRILKKYEALDHEDRSLEQQRISNYTIYIPKIPIPPERYHDKPELLKAMLC
jgi:hypothetical protein